MCISKCKLIIYHLVLYIMQHWIFPLDKYIRINDYQQLCCMPTRVLFLRVTRKYLLIMLQWLCTYQWWLCDTCSSQLFHLWNKWLCYLQLWILPCEWCLL
ncbi:hypothetical protein FGO68_gene11446 [Halteria grandinella]|uniref:Uncharacterized protein n=1 Tax=Halteria grandinella TaxID=5974 RepID=A0A8J8N9Z5_HALGN|nr:hypothetical protein FGO68_gene11446 [Halteria grandinella]